MKIALLTFVLPLWAGSAFAQERLTLAQAIERTLAEAPHVVAARAAVLEAGEQLIQARAEWMPRLDFTQSWQRGNQPVFVFGSLLAQRQFAAPDFTLESLNHPGAVTNSRSAIAIDQRLFDGGRTRAGVRRAELAAAEARAGERQARNDLALAATRAYSLVWRAEAERRVAESAVTAAEADVRTAEARRDAGTGTEADVLSMRLHLAQMEARAIDAAGGVRIARADLNRVMNVPLEHEWLLDDPAIAPPPAGDPGNRPDGVPQQHPLVEQAAFRREMSRTLWHSARSARLPQVSAQGAYEWNDGARGRPAGSWVVAAAVSMSLFAGGANTARMREASFAAQRSAAEYARVQAEMRFELLTATERLVAARARQAIGQAAVTQARESQRMIRDRYEAGVAPAGDVIRAATAVLDAEAQRINAFVDVLVGIASMRRAAGQEVYP